MAYNPEDQYADVPPPGFRIERWNDYALKWGDLVFRVPFGPWEAVRPGMNLVGATRRELSGVLGVAVPCAVRSMPLAEVPEGQHFRGMATGGLWMVKRGPAVVFEASGAPVPKRRLRPDALVWVEA